MDETRSEAWENRDRRVQFLRDCGTSTGVLQCATDEEVARMYFEEKENLKKEIER